ncbi:hypothetical protein BASA50_006579 [Batrachochytrium salamandrivorans]|uniref:Uridylate kinase n=1 Tax=Batrachochytrium salamandrivorans TaxID=1357716 RepID=A0ABQ8F9U6_9FUNG|nr:hypothetical protein BASA62_009177 [Batrachochytrium salamandrivorans]KAH6577188.1 hypothetical protein BASA60_004122 [Batrachochytrium salamandrivorans]KAH6582922.1 hypothetical protein BASA61_008334 [Batrachochytrium salamandrivorans]KAH6594629.1 hypothetical protein BASA50_006579 [Batrachochytrium salamandrivorans]KAH9252521.1 hypothetical protein BASA81_009564 [Batrachochytrium salamandrivorans]
MSPLFTRPMSMLAVRATLRHTSCISPELASLLSRTPQTITARTLEGIRCFSSPASSHGQSSSDKTNANHSSSQQEPKPIYSSTVPLMMLSIVGVLSAGYYYVTAGVSSQPAGSAPAANHSKLPKMLNETPTLPTAALEAVDPSTIVVFVLGGPGAGKGTQCAKLVKEFGYVHLSAGDLLREERTRKGSPFGELINTYIKEGLIVPMEITIALLHAAMKQSGGKRFLVDGFPRKMDQALKFEEMVCQSKLVLYFECPEEEMLKRLLKRGETSGRVDDNLESIKKRFQIFHETSYPVIEHYAALGKVQKVSCLQPVDKVFQDTKKVFEGFHL